MKRISGFVFLMIVFVYPAFGGNRVVDSLHLRLPHEPDTSKVKILCDLCWEYRFISADSSILFGQQALELAKKIKYKPGIAQANNDLGIIFIDLSRFAEATQSFQEAMKIRKEINDLPGQASLYNKLGIVDQKQGRLLDALENQINALKIYEQLGQEKWIGYCLNNIAIIHQNLGNLQKALDYHEKGLQLRIKNNDLEGEANSYVNIANVYTKLNDTDRALLYFEKALKISESTGNLEFISNILSNVSTVYLSKKEIEKAIGALDRSLKIRRKMGDRKGIASALTKLGGVYTETKQYGKALPSLREALKISREIGVIEEEMAATFNLANLFSTMQLYDSAFIAMKQYTVLRDTVYSQRLKQQIIEVQTRYETEKMTQDMELIRHEKEMTEISLRQRKTEILLLIFIIISITGAGIFLFYRHQQKQKAALAAETLRQHDLRMKAVLQVQEDERRRIAKELHDGVGQKLSGIKLNWQSLIHAPVNENNFPQLEVLEKLLDDASTEVRTISHQMMPKELEQFGLVPAIESMLRFSLGNTRIGYGFEHVGLNGRFDQNIELTLFRVLQEVVNNVIKHSQANQLSVQLLKHAENIAMIVSDDGIGFEVSKKENEGIGLMNIVSRVDSVKGVCHFESSPGQGTTVTIRIPLS